jgi:RNA polymerase sigma factor (sigma-70 family)
MDDLLERALKGDTKAERQLLEKLRVRFENFARHDMMGRDENDIQDVVQEAWAIVGRKYKTVTFEIGFEEYAFGVLKKVIKRYNAKKKRETQVFPKDPAPGRKPVELVAPGLDPVEWITFKDCLHQIFHKNYRYWLVLKFNRKGYPTDEICRRLKVKRGHFYVMLDRARSMLESCMKGGTT